MAKRPKKIVYGDQIQRSEYNDGVLRNNNRANNRLSREMLMYEKAQKVILKDLGKETQLLRSKLSMSTIASPRLGFAKNTTTDIEPFTIYGMSANPKSKKEPTRKVTLKPIYPSVVEGNATPRASFNPRTSFVNPRNHVVVSSSSRNGLADSRVEKVNSRNGLLDSRNNVLDSRNELVDGSVSARSGTLEPKMSSRTNMNSSRNSGVQLNALTNTPGKLTSSKSRRAMKSGKTGVSYQESESEFSTVEVRGGRASVVSDIKSRQQAPSRLSFIEILAEAEERKAKEAKLELEANSSTTTMLRPKTPILTIDGDVTASPNNVNEQYKSSRRGSHIGATPQATAVTVEQK